MQIFLYRSLLPILFLALFAGGEALAQLQQPAFAPSKPGRDFTLYKETGADIMARFRWFIESRMPEDGKPLYESRLRVWAQTRSMQVHQPNVLLKSGKVSDGVWTNIGPANQGGRLTGIAIDPTNANIVYIAAAAGGIWKSTTGGGDFQPISDDLPTLSMGAITVDPSNPNIVWVGTGEANGNLDSYPGIGIVKSTDAGQTWELTGFQDDTRISKIQVHPQLGDIVIAATLGGIQRTEDGGATWKRAVTGAVYDLAVNPVDPSQWYAGLRGVGMLRSIDTGRTWSNISKVWQDSLGLKLGDIQRIAFDLCRTEPETMYAVLVQYSGSSLYAILKTTDGGYSWQKLPTPSTNFFNSQGFYNCDLAVDPTDPDRLLIGGVRLYLSENGGINWSSRSTSHVDQHALEFAPSNPNIFYAGHDGGIDRSVSGGRSYTNVNGPLPITQFYDFAVSFQDPDIILGGAQDNGTRYSTSSSPVWNYATGGDGTYCVIDYSDKNIMYSKMQYGQSRWRTTNGGGNWVRIMNGLEDDGPWVTPTVIDPVDPLVLYTVTNYDFYKTTDRGAQWVKLSPRVTESGTIRVIAVSPVNTTHIATGYSGVGGVALSTDGGVTWNRIAASFPRTTVTDIEYHATDLNTIYATFSGKRSNSIYRTTDGGENWENISGNMPAISTNAIALNPNDDRTLYVGTDLGAYVTTDGGVNWAILGTGMPAAPVIDLDFHAPSGKLRAATHGRSIYELTVATGVEFETFSAVLDGDATLLTWTASIAGNFKGFAIERQDGSAGVWNEIGYVDGNTTGIGMGRYSFRDTELPTGTDAVVYRIKRIAGDGTFEYSHEAFLALTNAVPFDFALGQNYPNPFNPVTTITYTMPQTGHVRLIITGGNGTEIVTLVNGQKLPGSYSVQFDASAVPSGMYFYHLISNGKRLTRKMVVLK